MKENLQVDLAIIGAGIYGIQAARTYLEIHPKNKVVILEASKSVGGVWSAERIYDGFYTQTPLDILEFSDQPMHNVPARDQSHGFFSAHHVTTYLEKYMATHEYEGLALLDRVIFGADVESLSKSEGQFCIKCKSVQVVSPKVIDATGLTSAPNIPDIQHSSAFQGRILHHKEYGRSAILQDSLIKHLVVVGGAKSAADVAYSAAKAGKHVSWVIRRSGAGPAAFFSPTGQGPYRNSNEAFYTRMAGYFLANWWTDDNWFLRFVHQTSIGRFLFRKIWHRINKKSINLAEYDRADGSKNGFYNLKPDTNVFWANESPGINQRLDFFDTIARNVRVHRQDISGMYERGILLADGLRIPAEAIVFATGWKATHPYIETGLAAQLGLSVQVDEESESLERWRRLETLAKESVLTRFPTLAKKPSYHDYQSRREPFRLYNCMVPVTDQNIVFVGKMMLGNHFRNAEVQAIYAIAVLDRSIKLPEPKDMESEIARTVAWCRERYLAKGQLGSWFYFDMVPYTDMLLKQLGLSSHRHKSKWKDLFEPCFAKDLQNLLAEYRVQNSTGSVRMKQTQA